MTTPEPKPIPVLLRYREEAKSRIQEIEIEAEACRERLKRDTELHKQLTAERAAKEDTIRAFDRVLTDLEYVETGRRGRFF